MVGAGQRLNLTKPGEKLDKRPTSEWQIAAWRFFEQIGEIGTDRDEIFPGLQPMIVPLGAVIGRGDFQDHSAGQQFPKKSCIGVRIAVDIDVKTIFVELRPMDTLLNQIKAPELGCI